MKKLLQINVCSNLSTGRIAEDIASVAKQDGWQCYLAYSRGAEPKESKGIKIGGKLDVYEHALESRLWNNSGFASRYATKTFLQKVQELQPDLIHLHVVSGYYINLPLLFEFLGATQIPIVWTVHACGAFTAQCGHPNLANCERWKEGCYGRCPLLKMYAKSLFVDRTGTIFKRKKELFTLPKRMVLTPVSKWLGGMLKESFLKEYPIEVIYNGVDVNTFMPKPQEDVEALKVKYGLQGKFVLIGVASTWNKVKGLNYYIELSHRLPEDMRMVLIGLNEKQIRFLPANVIGLRRTYDLNELVSFYSMADVVLNLSNAETFGLTTVEGMACGTPSIVFDTTASPELIAEGTGYVAPLGDLDAVEKYIEQIRTNGKARYSENCRQNVLKNFDKQKNYRQYVDLYNRIVNEKKG